MNFTFIMDKLTTTLVLMVIETVGSRSAAARITLLMVPSCVALEKKILAVKPQLRYSSLQSIEHYMALFLRFLVD